MEADDDGADALTRVKSFTRGVTIGQRQEGLDLIKLKSKRLAGPVAGAGRRRPPGRATGSETVLALLDAGEATTHVHGGADLLEGLDLNG